MNSSCLVKKDVTPVQVWESTYKAGGYALPSQSPRWVSAIVSAGGYKDVSRLYEFADGLNAVLPLFAGRFPPGPHAMQFSPPATWEFGGMLATEKLTSAHVRAILEDLAKLPALMTQIRLNPLDTAIWQDAVPSGWKALPRIANVLNLSDGCESVSTKQFRQDTRNRIRRAKRAGLEIVSGEGPALIAEFHQLLRLSFKRCGKRQGKPSAAARWRGPRLDPETKFRATTTSAGSVFRLWVSRLSGKPVAATPALRDHEAHYTRGAMDEELAGQTYANYLQHSRAIEDACLAGRGFYHMGGTGNYTSLAQFKSRFGATSYPYGEHQIEWLPISLINRIARDLKKRTIEASAMLRPRFISGILVAAIAVFGITPVSANSSQPKDAPLLANGNWKRIFGEEFDAKSLNRKRWTTCYWWNDNGCTNLSNKEMQWYMPANIQVTGGHLRMTARPEPVKGINDQTFPFTSGMVTTGVDYAEIPREPRFAFRYGQIDIRAKLPAGKGLWPALWLLPANRESRPEIDIMEMLGDSPNLLRMHVHFNDSHGQRKSIGKNFTAADLTEDWHVFGLRWESKAIVWYLDGMEVWRFTDFKNIPREPMYLLMNLAVGGTWPGKPDRTTKFPAEFQIDYVRVWQRVPK